jgi:hypothetical protein
MTTLAPWKGTKSAPLYPHFKDLYASCFSMVRRAAVVEAFCLLFPPICTEHVLEVPRKRRPYRNKRPTPARRHSSTLAPV